VTRDLAAAIDRYQRFEPAHLLYVVATDQSLHFKQLFTVLKKMGRTWADRAQHVNFGRVHGMSTRKGNLVLLTDVLDEAKSLALEKVRENQKVGRIQTNDPEGLADQIGLGAVVFGDLKNRRVSDYTFDWDELLSFEGHTGPYVQYAHARACNILTKAGGLPTSYEAARLELPEEQAVVRAVARFPDEVAAAVADNEPSYVARHLLEITTLFSRWYTLGNQERQKRVLVDDDPGARAARVVLVDAVRATLAAGLGLLGVPAPEAM
jgi:arginyl-tRNA synthetase